MDHRLPRLTLCALLTLLALPTVSHGQEDSGYKPVEAEYLAANLPQFWATGLAFLDTVTKPVIQVKQKVGEKTYVQFETKTLGRCYVDAALGGRLDLIAPGQDLIFTATVLHQKRGFFSFGGEPQYFVAVINIQPALRSVAGLPDQMSGFALPTTSPDARVLANVDELLKGLQTEIAVLARERGIPAWELMAPGTTNRTEVELVVTRGVNSLASAMEVETHDVLGQMLMAIMAARVQPQQPATPPAGAAPVPPAEPADVVVTKPAREPAADTRQPAASGVIEPAVEIAGAAAPAAMEDEQANLARAKAAEEKQARMAAEQAAANQAAQEKAAKAELKRLAREKAAHEEAARAAAEQAADEKAAREKKARAEQQRLERERLAAEKKAAAEQARLAEEQAEREADARAAAAKAEKKRLADELKARDEAARAAAKAAAEAPKMRASTTVEAATGTVLSEPKAAQPSAKLQPKPAAEPPPPPPAAGEDDPNAPVPL